jgi:AcrR family transcriptional regulator
MFYWMVPEAVKTHLMPLSLDSMSKADGGSRKKTRKTQEERTAATTAVLLRAARELFSKKGFADTATEDILNAAGVTRGALYHHFDNKAALFRAVFENEEAALTARLMKVAQTQPDALSGLHAGCRAFLEACLDPVVQRIVLRDARAVLSLDELREIESRYTLAALRNGLSRAIASGAMVERSAEMLAHMILGALSEAAMAIARSPHPKKVLKDALREFDHLLEGLTRKPAGS